MADAIETLRGRVDTLATEIRTLSEKDAVTPEEDARLDEALTEREAALEEIVALEAREARLAAFRESDAPVVRTERTISAPNMVTRTNPFDLDELRGADPEKRALEVRARAIDIVNTGAGAYELSDSQSEDLVKKLNGRSRVAKDIAELVAQTGSEEYREAFEAVLASPHSVAALGELQARGAELEKRAAIQTAGVSGALHVPYQLDPTLILNNAGVVDPMRAISRNVQISGTDKWAAPTSAGITAALVGESVAFTDNSPTYTSTVIQTYKAGAHAFGSWEAMADSGAADDLGMMFADAKVRFEAGYFATGTGSSQPQGVVVFASNATSIFAGTSGAANSADLTAADIYSIQANLSPRWRGESSWVSSLNVAHTIRQLGTSTNFHAFSLDITQAGPPQLLGRPYYENSSMDTVVASGSTDFALLLGDFSQFVIVDRVGMTIQYNPAVTSGSKFLTGESSWTCWWRFGSGGLVQDAFRLYKI